MLHYIYGIYNKISGELYIGLTNNMKRRWGEHCQNAKILTDRSYPVHYAMNKLGIENFIHMQIDIAP